MIYSFDYKRPRFTMEFLSYEALFSLIRVLGIIFEKLFRFVIREIINLRDESKQTSNKSK